VLVPEHDAGSDLDFQRVHRLELRLREHAHVPLAERGVVDDLSRECPRRAVDLLSRQLERRRIPAVEPFAVLADGVHSVALEVEEHVRHDARRLRIRFEQAVAAVFDDLHEVIPELTWVLL
jgi:hypothetical protein